MRSGETLRVFDRTNWRRKARVPSWLRSSETEKLTAASRDAKHLKGW